MKTFLRDNNVKELIEIFENKTIQTQLKHIFKKKDKMKPKKSKSAYIYFCDKYRPILNKENMKITDLTILLGQKWKEIKNDKTELLEFQKLAEKDKERYLNEMEQYTPLTEKENKQKKKEIK